MASQTAGRASRSRRHAVFFTRPPPTSVRLSLLTRISSFLRQAYYAEWEALTLVPEEELNRPMTLATFAKFVPMWLRYNALPGPVRYWLFKDKVAGDQKKE